MLVFKSTILLCFRFVSSDSYYFNSLFLPSCEFLELLIGLHFELFTVVLSVSLCSFLSGCSGYYYIYLSLFTLPSFWMLFWVKDILFVNICLRRLLLGRNLRLTILFFQRMKNVPLPLGLYGFWWENLYLNCFPA